MPLYPLQGHNPFGISRRSPFAANCHSGGGGGDGVDGGGDGVCRRLSISAGAAGRGDDADGSS